MFNDIILKGKGVFKQLKDGTMVRMSFPGPDSPHKEMSHFHIDHKTNLPHKEVPDHMRYWPKEAAARFFAEELVKQGYPEGRALKFAKHVFNKSATRFNNIKRKNGDDFHTMSIPFDEDGNLHPDYKTNQYGSHEARRVPTSRRRTRARNGKMINNHANNAPHPTAGRGLESAAFHDHKEFQDEIKDLGFESQLGSRSNVFEPQHIIRAPGEDGEMTSVLRRYNSNEKDPTHPDNNTFPTHHGNKRREQAFYGAIQGADIIATLAQRYPRFFIPHTGAGAPPKIVIKDLQEQGVNKRLAEQMARVPIAQMMLGRGKKGSPTQFNNLLDDISNYLEVGYNPDVTTIYHKHKGQFARLIQGMDRGRTDAAIRLMSMLKTAEELKTDISPALGGGSAPQSVVSGWNRQAIHMGGKPVDFEAMGLANEPHPMHNKVDADTSHYYDTVPAHIDMDDYGEDEGLPPPDGGGGGAGGGPPLDQPSTQEPASDDPFAEQGGSVPMRATGGNPPWAKWGEFSQFPAFATSNDDPMGAIATIMERVQMHDSWEDARIMKMVTQINLNPQNNDDMLYLAKQFDLESNDVRAIAMTIGDWDNIAKHFQVRRDVVNIIKVSCGGY
ncbi:MAG: hypothetical protein HOC79_08815 [Euryarchaeota archaeon]|nr:hypothetical protein [Euryarchaeota archaeon]